MKKIIDYIFSIILMLCLGGCAKPENELPDIPDTGYQANISMDPVSWVRDNSLDAYSQAAHMPLQMEEPENAGGVRKFFLGAGRAYCYANHVLGTAKESWDELAFVTADEEAGSHRFDFENRLFGIGPVAGTDHYIGFDYESAKGDGEENRYFLTERDENHQTVKEIPLDFLASPSDTLVWPTYLAVDGSGIIHLLYQADGGQKYLLISPEGELLSSTGSNAAGLVPLYDGSIAFWEENWGSDGRWVGPALWCMDRETGKPTQLASLKTDDRCCVTLFDKSTLLYADREGVYRSSLSGENPELLYRWINHGIDMKSIIALQADVQGEISLIYEDSENYNYLRLKPTTEEVEVCTITLAEANDVYNSKYKLIVTAFNKRYPQWHIELKNDYEETALLTQLGAGDGPVLIDTRRTGFEELEKLWEPLDTFMEQPGITEELVSSAMDRGKIHGIQYGIVTDFWLSTLVTGNQELKEWDYDTFLQCIADSPRLEAFSNISDYYAGGNYGAAFIMGYFANGIDDAYFWDAEAGTTNFDSSEFRQALELAKKYCSPREGVPPDRTLLEEGKVLVNSWSISLPQEAAGLRIIYGEDANYIGYPTKNGSLHYIIYGSSPLAVRRTATEEEKKVAVAFINFLLSYEGQQLAAKAFNFNMSVRWDMLEEQIAAMNRGTKVHMGESGIFQFSLSDQVNVELDRETLLHWIDMAEPAKGLPRELSDIMDEELEQYFSGAITEDVLIDRLESRVGLYLNERK